MRIYNKPNQLRPMCAGRCFATPLLKVVRLEGRDLMTITHIQCNCGAVEVRLSGEPLMQYVCHCDDCQAVHGKAYPVAVYLASAVVVTCGKTATLTLKTSPRIKCKHCATYLFAEVSGSPMRGVNADLLSGGRFVPAFHIQCKYALAQVEDDLPHYKDTPVKFGGSGELMPW